MLSSPPGVAPQARHSLHTSQLKTLWSSALHLNKRLLAQSSLLLPPLPLAPPTISYNNCCSNVRVRDPVAHQDGSNVPNYSSYLNLNSSSQFLPSSLQPSHLSYRYSLMCPRIFSTRPLAPALRRRPPSEGSIDLCFTLTKRRETPVLQNSPGEYSN